MTLSCHDLSCLRERWRGRETARIERVTAEFSPGSLCGITGPHGAGKGLLLNLLGLIEQADTGKILLEGRDVTGLNAADRADVRDHRCGFLFAQTALLPSLTVAENVAMPIFRILGMDAASVRDRTLEVLRLMEVEADEGVPAGTLSVRDAWRTAFARAIAHWPGVVVAIAPAGTPDLLPLARTVAEQTHTCILWSGPAATLEPHCHRLIHLENGRIVRET